MFPNQTTSGSRLQALATTAGEGGGAKEGEEGTQQKQHVAAGGT